MIRRRRREGQTKKSRQRLLPAKQKIKIRNDKFETATRCVSSSRLLFSVDQFCFFTWCDVSDKSRIGFDKNVSPHIKLFWTRLHSKNSRFSIFLSCPYPLSHTCAQTVMQGYKSDILQHSYVKAVCTWANTWSLSTCQRGLTRGLRCLEELGGITLLTSWFETHKTTSKARPDWTD